MLTNQREQAGHASAPWMFRQCLAQLPKLEARTGIEPVYEVLQTPA